MMFLTELKREQSTRPREEEEETSVTIFHHRIKNEKKSKNEKREAESPKKSKPSAESVRTKNGGLPRIATKESRKRDLNLMESFSKSPPGKSDNLSTSPSWRYVGVLDSSFLPVSYASFRFFAEAEKKRKKIPSFRRARGIAKSRNHLKTQN